jgi:hypothetical protein
VKFTQETLALIKGLRKDVTTSGIATGTGLNFFYLEAQAKNIYPVFYPILASTPRVNPMFNGMKVGGLATNWKAIVGIDAGGYPAVSEGNRNSFLSVSERNYASTYKFLGKDIQTSFQAQQTGLGFDDNVALAQLSLLNALLNDEERMILYGNSGPASVGGNGYALGLTPTPVIAQSNATGAAVTASAQNYVFCVALTPWGVQLAGSTGVKLPFLRSNADSSQDSINGGTGIISGVSNTIVTDSSHKSITATVTAVTGAAGYAWYLNQTDNTKTTAYFVGVTSTPTTIIMATPSVSNQKANAADTTGTSKDLTTDNSYNLLDFDGILTWHFGTSGSSQPAYLADMGGAGFTSNGDGTIKEFEDCADYLWKNYKASVDKIYVGGSLIQSASRAVLTGASTTGAQRLYIERGTDGSVSGGQIIRTYHWKYSTSGAPKDVEVVTHPWLPDGVILFDITTNPYPAAGDAIPSVRRIVSLEDHFSIKWPYRKLQHEIGVYCFETMQHYLPFCGGVVTGVANKVN